jgi:UDP-N-acetylmuramate dehydrogenase
MMIYKNVSLKKYNTFGLNYKAESMVHLSNEKEAIELFAGGIALDKPFLVLGSGSNILFTSDFNGTILFPEIPGIKIEKLESSKGEVIVSAGAGLIWDDFVAWTVENGFGGLENLSLIPGKIGATPVQNIGAYGSEVKYQIASVRALNMNDGSIRVFENNECEFGYRNSIFKNSEKGRYLITRVYYRLAINPKVNLSYGSLKEEVNKLGKETLQNTRQAVINIRRSKLPDPEVIGNAGSFFKNPVVKKSLAASLKNTYPDMPIYPDHEGYMKIASGWLIDRCGWKGKRTGDAGVHEKQALVLVNYGKASGLEIYTLSEEIKKTVNEKFGINLEREVEVVGTI